MSVQERTVTNCKNKVGDFVGDAKDKVISFSFLCFFTMIRVLWLCILIFLITEVMCMFVHSPRALFNGVMKVLIS